MSKLKSVKEVRKITGLDGRALFEYKEIIKPAAYANEGHRTVYYDKNNDDHEYYSTGYKLYDDGAIEKLQIIKICKLLNMKKKEIVELIQNESLNKEALLTSLVEKLQNQKEEIDRNIEWLKSLKSIGIGEVSLNQYLIASQDYIIKGKSELFGNKEIISDFESEKWENYIAEITKQLEIVSDDRCLNSLLDELLDCYQKGEEKTSKPVLLKCKNVIDYLESKSIRIRPYISFFASLLIGNGTMAKELYKDSDDLRYVVEGCVCYLFLAQKGKILRLVKKIEGYIDLKINTADIQNVIKELHCIFIELAFIESKKLFKEQILFVLNSYGVIKRETMNYIEQAVNYYCNNGDVNYEHK